MYFYLSTIYLIVDAPNHEWFKIIKRIAFLEDGKVKRTITLSAHQRVGGSEDRLAADGNKMKFESRQELWNSAIASTAVGGSYGTGCRTMMMIVIIHMGSEYVSREKKLSMVIFFIFVQKNVSTIRFQEIKIRPFGGFEKMRFLCFYIIGV